MLICEEETKQSKRPHKKQNNNNSNHSLTIALSPLQKFLNNTVEYSDTIE